ncbi:hypothetical protein PENTCL1PPCAC_22400, partial [Pristionchus entomophagus]
FRFANVVDVNVRQFTKTQNELEPLHLALTAAEAEGKISSWKPSIKPRPQNGWDVPWTAEDDAAILKGIHKYGAGSWEAIKMDPALGLADKIHLKDKMKKPQPKHVQQRAEYLLKLIGGGGGVKREKKGGGDGGLKERKRVLDREKDRDRKRKERDEKKKEGGGGEKDEKEKEKKEKKKDISKKEHHHREKKDGGEKKNEKDTKESGLESFLNAIVINMATYGPALDDNKGKVFTECVNMMRPVHKYIKRLSSEDEKEKSKSVQRIGEHAREEMKKLKKRNPESNISKWYNYVWIFIAKFCSQEPMDLLISYRAVESKRETSHKHKEKNHHGKKDGKGMEKDGEKMKEKKK